MSKYKIKTYQPGFEEEQDRIEIELGKEQPWFGIGLSNYFSDPNFDSNTVLSCFKGEKMVGFLRAKLTNEGPAIMIHERPSGYIQIPSVLPGHDEVEDLLMKKIMDFMEAKGTKYVQVRVSTMWKNSIQLAEKWGFKPVKDFELGYKKYYNFDLSKNIPFYSIKDVQPFQKERDLRECTEAVANFFKMPEKKARNWIMEVDSHDDLVSHLVIREDERVAGYCFTLPNTLNRDVTATFYIEATKEDFFKQLIVQTMHDCKMKMHKYFLVDLLKDLLRYEDAVVSLGLKNASTFGIYEKMM